MLTLPEHLSFSGVRVTRSLVLCVCFVDRCLSFFFRPWFCLFFFELRILITPLVSSDYLFGIFNLFLKTQQQTGTSVKSSVSFNRFSWDINLGSTFAML